jgi:lipoprotein-anchoring transpeptidase ErfK/SrfK
MKKLHLSITVGIAIVAIVLVSLFFARGRKNVEEAPKAPSLKEAKAALEQGRLGEAKALYQEAMDQEEDVGRLKNIQGQIEEINTKIIFSSSFIDGCSTEYTVRPKDVLSKIAKRFNTTVRLIKRVNNLASDTIRPKQKLKVNTCKFSIVIDKSQNLLFLKRKNEVIKTYIVATGKDNGTPTGIFKIVNKLVKPTWYKTGAVIPPDSPKNVLGSRWMGFDLEGYGIHGTNEPDKLGQQITLGCVRMSNEEVEELFSIVPTSTEVTILD